MLGGGGVANSKHKVFSCEAKLGGLGACSPRFLFKNGAIRSNLMHSMTQFSLHYFAVLRSFLLPLQTSLKTKKLKNLKCDLMVLKMVLTSAGTVLIPFLASKKKSSSWT